ncbi:MAG TPA: AraC family transcriptional regulator [Gaiellaceae bacterium]|nr:AraC family transcriptional regulator [Gaiellaceae bacterium]
MLSRRTFVERDGMAIADVACRSERGRGHGAEHTSGHALVFVRRGCFVRNADGVASTFALTLAYCINPGQEERCDHPNAGGDDCTVLHLSPEVVASLQGGDPSLPRRPLVTSPEIDLAHRVLLAGARRGDDPEELVERALALAADALEQDDPRPVAAGRPRTARARRALVAAAREALASDPRRSLPQLARELAVSAHHLSRVFSSGTGTTISRHRLRLRVRAALERLAGGEPDLARLAAELGFADQSHLCRAVRSEMRRTPSALRNLLGGEPDALGA